MSTLGNSLASSFLKMGLEALNIYNQNTANLLFKDKKWGWLENLGYLTVYNEVSTWQANKQVNIPLINSTPPILSASSSNISGAFSNLGSSNSSISNIGASLIKGIMAANYNLFSTNLNNIVNNTKSISLLPLLQQSSSASGANPETINIDGGSTASTAVSSALKNIGTATVSAATGMLASAATSLIGELMGLGNTQIGLLTTGLGSQIVGSAAGNAMSSALGSSGGGIIPVGAAGWANAGAGVANLALDVFDPVQKADWENGVNLALGIGSLINPWVGVGTLAFNVIGHATGKKADTFTADTDLLSLTGNSYTDSTLTILNAQLYSGRKYSGWNNGGRNHANRVMAEARRLLNTIGDIIDYNTNRLLLADNMSSFNLNKYAFAMQGGYQQDLISRGKNGLKFSDKAKSIVARYNKIKAKKNPNLEETQIEEFKEGGRIREYLLVGTYIEEYVPFIEETQIEEFKEGGRMNVIPEGALHARLNNMDTENITKKGIPVVSEDKEGNIEQHAEIECGEIILRLSVTQKLEELAKQDTDEAAIEAGKLLVEEILYNTIDNTNNLL